MAQQHPSPHYLRRCRPSSAPAGDRLWASGRSGCLAEARCITPLTPEQKALSVQADTAFQITGYEGSRRIHSVSRRPCPEPPQVSLANQTPLPLSSIRMKSCYPPPAGPRKGKWTQKDTATWAGLCTHNQIHKGGLPSPGPTRPSVLTTCFLSLAAAWSSQLQA